MRIENLCLIIIMLCLANAKKRVHNRNLNQRQNIKTTTKKSEDVFNTEIKSRITNITAKVGETVVLNCAINSSLSPGAIWTQGKIGNVLTFNTNRITVDPRFDIIQHSVHKEDELLSDSNQVAKLNDVSIYNLQIDNIQLYDENEYACQTSITKSNEDEPLIHSLIHLYVTQSPSFIESQTSESNIAGLENGEIILKCTATGKPVPRIRWYQIDDNSGSIIDLNHESTNLLLKNLSKFDNNKYECVASNGILPSVSKKFSVTVYYGPIISTIQPHLNHNSGQSVILGCVVNSNPESTIAWFKLDNQTKIFINSYLRIEETDSRYTINKIKQSNHTISYLKIRNITHQDLTKYKCEASNLIGKSEAILELMDYKESLFKTKKTKVLISKKVDKIQDSNEYQEDVDEQYSIRRKDETFINSKKYSISKSETDEDDFYQNKNSLVYDTLENKSNKLTIYLYIVLVLNLIVFKLSYFF